MSRLFAVMGIVAALTAPMTIPTSALAHDDGQVAAFAGGALGGLFLGGLLAQHPHYVPQYYGPVYYAAPPPRCYWTRGEVYWDDFIGAWRRPRIRVCD
jgi:hypothetical protein